MSDFKLLNKYTFKNVGIVGMYEYKIKPLEMIFNVRFSLTPTVLSRKTFSSIKLFQEHLENNKLGHNAICSGLKKINLPYDWKLFLPICTRYTYDHDLSVVKFNGKSCFGLDINMIMPDRYCEQRCNPNLEREYLYILCNLSKIHSFQNDEFLMFDPHR